MKKALIALLAASCAIPAFAGETYAGASVGSAKHKLSIDGDESLSKNTTSFKVFGGYQFTPAIGAEIGYAHFGKASVSGTDGTTSASMSGDPSAVYAAVTGTLPLSKEFSAFGKVGVAQTHTKVNMSYQDPTYSFSGEDSTNETTAVIGVGLGYAITPKVGVTVEYENFGKVAKGDGLSYKLDQFSVGVRVKF